MSTELYSIEQKKFFQCVFCNNVNEINEQIPIKKQTYSIKLENTVVHDLSVHSSILGLDLNETMKYLLFLANKEAKANANSNINWQAPQNKGMQIGIPTTESFESEEDKKKNKK